MRIMTAHEIAEALLAMPNKPVEFVRDFFAAPEYVLSIYEEGDVITVDIGEEQS